MCKCNPTTTNVESIDFLKNSQNFYNFYNGTYKFKAAYPLIGMATADIRTSLAARLIVKRLLAFFNLTDIHNQNSMKHV